MFPVVVPHFLFWNKKKEPEVLTNELLNKIHEEIHLSIINMNSDSSEVISNHVNRVNKMMRSKWGEKWIDYEIR